jgi:hypothetical protein
VKQMLVYTLPQTGAIFSRFGGINGSAYLVGGFGMTALTANNIVLVPIRSGIGLRLRSQHRLPEVHRSSYLEPVLILQCRLADAAHASVQRAIDQPDEVPSSHGFLTSCPRFQLNTPIK